jgi:hypothetical protein
MEAIAPTRMGNANAPLDGRGCFANRPVGQDSTASTARSSAIARTELRVITLQVSTKSNSSNENETTTTTKKLLFKKIKKNQANVRAALDSRMTHAMPPVRKADSV